VGTVIEFDYTDDRTPTAGGCPTCGRSFLVLKDDHPDPKTHAEVWRPPVICRGNAKWSWCKRTGDVTFPDKRVVYLSDRRKTPR